MPQLPIPDDWNGTDWTCIQVQWPDSTEYLAVLAGFLSYLTRGRAYDAETGSIKDAQAIGWEIFRRNMPYKACSEDTPTPETPSTGDLPCDWCYEGVEPCGEDEMSCCIDDLKWIDGKLWYRQCGKWYEVDGEVVINQMSDEDDSVVDTPEGQEDSWACAKAHAITELLWKVATAFYDALTEASAWEFAAVVEAAAGIPLSNASLVSREIVWGALENLGDIQALNATDKKQFRCYLASVLDGSNNDLGQNQYEMIRDDATLATYGRISLDRMFMSDMVSLIGLQNFRTATRGISNSADEYDCTDCTSESVIPPDATWSHEYDFTLEDFGWTPTGTSGAYETGVGFTADVQAYGDTIAGCLKAAGTPLADTRLTFYEITFGDWPISDTNSGYWAKVVPTAINTDMSLYGHQKVSGNTNTAVGQGVVLEFSNVQCYENPAIGGPASLVKLIIAGTGDDPFSGDPPYTP